MISKILKLQNIGLFRDATPNGAIQLREATAIYAENGRGKSTLASIFRACQLRDGGRLNARKTIDADGTPEVDLLLSDNSRVQFSANVWNGNPPKIAVFDAEFVELNVYSGVEVRADQRQSLLEFALGDNTVQLKQQIDHLTVEIEAQTRKRSAAERLLRGVAEPYSLEQFLNLQPIEGAEAQIDSLRKRVEAARNAGVLTARRDPAPLVPIQFDVAMFFKVLEIQLSDVEEDAESLVLAHLSGHSQTGLENWTSQGQRFLDGETCPFCGQTINGVELIKAYRSYFSAAYADLKLHVAGLEVLVQSTVSQMATAAIVATVATNAALIDAWKDRLTVQAPELDGDRLNRDVSKLRELLLSLAEIKQRSPLERAGSNQDCDEAVSSIAAVNATLREYNAALGTVLEQISEYKKMLASENVQALLVEIRRLEAARRRVATTVAAAAVEFVSAEADRGTLDAKKTDLRDQLDKDMEATLQAYQESINELIGRFGAEFSIEQLKPTYQGGGEPRSEYGLSLRNRSVKLGSRSDLANGCSFGTALSEGDKRTLAFSFFLARLYADSHLAEKLVVFDDPVSSLDRNRRHQTLLILADLVGKCRQVIVLSHDAYFVREFHELVGARKAPVESRVLCVARVSGGYSGIAECDIEDVCASAYYRHHKLVADFVDGKSTGNGPEVAKAIRPMLEGYYHRRFPGRIPKRLMFGEVLGLVAQAAPGDPLANLRPVIGEAQAVNGYVGQFHHDTNANADSVQISEAELLTYGRRALQLIYQNG